MHAHRRRGEISRAEQTKGRTDEAQCRTRTAAQAESVLNADGWEWE